MITRARCRTAFASSTRRRKHLCTADAPRDADCGVHASTPTCALCPLCVYTTRTRGRFRDSQSIRACASVYRRDVTGCLCCLTPGGNAGRNIPSPESWSRRCGVYSCSMRPRIRPLVGGATILAWGEFGIREFGSPDTRIIRVFTSRMGVNEMNTCHVFIYCGEYAYNSRIDMAPLTNSPRTSSYPTLE